MPTQQTKPGMCKNDSSRCKQDNNLEKKKMRKDENENFMRPMFSQNSEFIMLTTYSLCTKAYYFLTFYHFNRRLPQPNPLK
jgi:hypothetical protein